MAFSLSRRSMPASASGTTREAAHDAEIEGARDTKAAEAGLGPDAAHKVQREVHAEPFLARQTTSSASTLETLLLMRPLTRTTRK
jgi:hypothetical protein